MHLGTILLYDIVESTENINNIVILYTVAKVEESK
jgi:hypothetical protein